jgi:hypothetical protein
MVETQTSPESAVYLVEGPWGRLATCGRLAIGLAQRVLNLPFIGRQVSQSCSVAAGLARR